MKPFTKEQAQAHFNTGVSAGFHRLGANVPGKLVAPENFRFAFEQRVPGDMREADPRASNEAPADMEPGLPDKNYLRMEATARGYTGDECIQCNNFTMVRNGTCLKCDTCGSTTGCS